MVGGQAGGHSEGPHPRAPGRISKHMACALPSTHSLGRHRPLAQTPSACVTLGICGTFPSLRFCLCRVIYEQ